MLVEWFTCFCLLVLIVSFFLLVTILFNCLVLLLYVLVNLLYFVFPADDLNGV